MSGTFHGKRTGWRTRDRRGGTPRQHWLVGCLLAVGITAAAGPSAAGEASSSVRLRYDRQELISIPGARRLLRRIGDAALEACGASPFSLSEFKMATRRSRCWKDAVADTVRRIGSPTLDAVAQEELQ